MLKSAEIQKGLSELREQINGYNEHEEDLTVEQRADRTKLERKSQELEPELRGALVAEGIAAETRQWTGDAESVEYRQMVAQANLGTIFDTLLAHQNPTGVEAELQKHHNLQGNQVPLDVLRGSSRGGAGGGGLETRAVTPGAANVGQNQHAIIPYVFPQSAAAWLGVDMPSVPAGDAVFPVLTGTLDVGTPAENTDQDETTGAFSSDVLTPKRLQASFFYSREDRARFATMDAALRMNLSDGLSDGLDKEIIGGTLLDGTKLPNNNVTVADTYDTYISHLMYGQIDGRYAAMASDLRMVVGADSYADLGATYRNTSVDRSALDRLMEMTGGVRVSAHVPATSNANRQNVVIMRGMSMTAVAPTWEGVTLIPDEVTLSKKGQIQITAVMLFATKVLRTGAGLVKQQVQHS